MSDNDELETINNAKQELKLDDVYINEQGFTHDDYVNMSTKWRNDEGDATHRINYPLNKDSVVLDIGGYIGVWAINIYCKYGCKVFIYEPIAHYAHVLRGKFSGNIDIEVMEYGLAHVTAETVMSITGEASSLIVDSEEHIKVKLRDIIQELDERNFDTIDLMKINIEGAEYLLLERLLEREDLIEKISNIQVQFHIWTKNYESRRDDIRNKLSNTHELTYDYPFIWENWRRKNG